MFENEKNNFNENEVIGKRVNIFDLLPPIDLYNKNENISNYLGEGYFDTYNYYPNIYKTIGNYLYNNFFFDKREEPTFVIPIQQVHKVSNDIFEYLINKFNYIVQEYPLLKDVILIVVLDEIERNNYQIEP